MAILANDIKLVASRVMDDFPEGGGAPTATVIVDGASNAIFPDISELDRAGGDVSFRKLFVHVQTSNTDTYLGANVIVAEPPVDPNVSVTLFSTGATFDERQEASGRVESYLVSGPEWSGYLFETHVAGQRAVQIFQRPEINPPNVGQTLILVFAENLPAERIQYVRVTNSSVAIRTFTKSNGDAYQAGVVTCDISDPLRLDFPGSPPNEYFLKAPNSSKVRETSVGDAAVYAGVSPTTQAIAIGDISTNVKSIFTQLVPSAQTETPLIDQNAAGQNFTLVPASNGSLTLTSVVPFNSTTNLTLSSAVVPGSLSIAVAGGAVLTDTGGQVYDGVTVVGAIDYARGVITFPSLTTPYTGLKTITFAGAAAPLRVSDTAQIAVTPESRAYNYVLTVLPTPSPGSVLVSYRSQGRWYDLRDNGGGVLRGVDSSYGAGSVSYSTGVVSVTLGALPDDGSAVLFLWTSRVGYLNRAGLAVAAPGIEMTLTTLPVQPGSVVISWNDGTPRTASDDGSGNITGAASGTIEYASGKIRLSQTVLPAGGQEYTVAHSVADPASAKTHNEVAPVRESDTTIVFSLGSTNITPGTVRLDWPVALVNLGTNEVAPPRMNGRDDGHGVILDQLNRVAGTINYASGVISFQPDGPVTTQIPSYEYAAARWVVGPGFRVVGISYAPRAAVMPTEGTIACRFQAGGTPASGGTQVFSAGAVKLDITNRYAEQIVPGSVNFTMGGRAYFDRLGSLYTDLNVATGEAISAGTINYSTGEVTVTEWSPGVGILLAVTSLVTTTNDRSVAGVTFRIPVSPIRPGSVQVLATKATGGLINATATLTGAFATAGVRGKVDYETGVVSMEFGTMVTAAGNESQPWYDPTLIVAGQIWKPQFVFADTIRFNAVAFSYLPLDAAVLGLDPVRLPQDGRVPIFRPGTFTVIGHSKDSAPMTVTNAQTVNLGRVRLSRVRVVGNNGATITDGYTANLDAGTITFNNVTGYSQPVTIEDRIEDMLLLSDVQINGALTFTRQISHAYPIGSYIASALVINDMKARVSRLFDQASWDGTTWSDTMIGSPAPGTYNNTLAPLVMTNRGAVTERWALRFTSTTSFQVIGEHVGVIETGTINADCSPINPATGTPYFTIRETGWGIGWSVGNVVRLDTVGAVFPVWVVRTVQQGAETVQDDSFTILVRGDVDRP